MPQPKSSLSRSSVCSQRRAALRAIPAPMMPPPATMRSKVKAATLSKSLFTLPPAETGLRERLVLLEQKSPNYGPVLVVSQRLDRVRALRQPRYRARCLSRSPSGIKDRSSFQRDAISARSFQKPTASPARYAAPRDVVSTDRGRDTFTPSMSAWNCARKLLAAAPPSARISVGRIPEVASIALTTSHTWYAIDSRAALTR